MMSLPFIVSKDKEKNMGGAEKKRQKGKQGAGIKTYHQCNRWPCWTCRMQDKRQRD